MIEYAPNTFELSEDEQEMVDLLKKEMGLEEPPGGYALAREAGHPAGGHHLP